MSQEFGICWEALFVLRNSLLNVVERKLKRVYGDEGWWKQGIATRFSKERQKRLKEIFDSRTKNVLSPMEGDERELLDLSDLYKVVEGEWAKVFKAVARSR